MKSFFSLSQENSEDKCNIHLISARLSPPSNVVLSKISLFTLVRVAEVAREHGWHPPKSLDSDENFKPEHTFFCRELRFVANYALFGDLWAKEVPFWVKNSVSWARSALLHGIYCIFY